MFLYDKQECRRRYRQVCDIIVQQQRLICLLLRVEIASVSNGLDDQVRKNLDLGLTRVI